MLREDELKTIDEATQTFAALGSSRLSDPSTEPAYYSIVIEDILGGDYSSGDSHWADCLRNEDAQGGFGQRTWM
jgi:hypothetical protein